MGGEKGGHLDRAEAAEGDQRRRLGGDRRRARPARAGGGGRGRRGPAEEGRSGAGGREEGTESQCDFAQGRLCCTDMQEGKWLAPKGEGRCGAGRGERVGPVGQQRTLAARREQRGGSCCTLVLEHVEVTAGRAASGPQCERRARSGTRRARRAGLRAARAEPRAAQSTPRGGKTLLALMWTERRRRLGGERRLVGELVYRERIDGRDDCPAHNRMPHKRGFAKE